MVAVTNKGHRSEHVFVIVRIDGPLAGHVRPDDLDFHIRATKAYRSRNEALTQVKRLEALQGGGVIYFATVARLQSDEPDVDDAAVTGGLNEDIGGAT